MFKEFAKKLNKNVYIAVTGFLLIISIVFSIFYINFVSNEYKNDIQDNLTLAKSIFTTQINKIELALSYLSTTTLINDYLENNNNSTNVVNLLENFKNNTEIIIGVTLYSNNSPLSNYSISEKPLFTDLLKISEIDDFTKSDKTLLLNLRTEYISSAYFNNPYKAEDGLLSIFYKINNKGYLVADLSTVFLYKSIFNFNSFNYFKNSTTNIRTHNLTLLNSEINKISLNIDNLTPNKLNNNTILFNITEDLYLLITFDFSLVLSITLFFLILFFINALFFLIILFIYHKIKKIDLDKMSELYLNMQKDY
ncbi:MAG: hypothetical protein LBM99_03495 [Bacillales bacterium]|jgi:hypothetical protein|nr:hypothetical protein [Bacillales bacterium]